MTGDNGWNRRVWDNIKFCATCEYKGAKWTVFGFPEAHALYCGFAPWVEESQDSAGMCNAAGNARVGSYVFMAHDNGIFMGKNGPGSGFNWDHKSDWSSTDANGFNEFRIELQTDGSAIAYYGGESYEFAIPTGKGITASTKFRFGCATHSDKSGFENLQYIAGQAPTPAPTPVFVEVGAGQCLTASDQHPGTYYKLGGQDTNSCRAACEDYTWCQSFAAGLADTYATGRCYLYISPGEAPTAPAGWTYSGAGSNPCGLDCTEFVSKSDGDTAMTCQKRSASAVV